jgi:hypothetical protein
MAIVPQMVIRMIAFEILEPPVFAEVAPRIIRNRIVNP